MTFLQGILDEKMVFFLKMLFVLVGLPIIISFSVTIVVGLFTGDVRGIKCQ